MVQTLLRRLESFAREADGKGGHGLAEDLRRVLRWHKRPDRFRRVTICVPGDRSVGIFPLYEELCLHECFFDGDQQETREALRAAFNRITDTYCGVVFAGECPDCLTKHGDDEQCPTSCCPPE